MTTEKRLIYLEDAIAKIVDTPSVVAEKVFDGQYGYDQNPAVLVDRQFEIISLLEEVPTVATNTSRVFEEDLSDGALD